MKLSVLAVLRSFIGGRDVPGEPMSFEEILIDESRKQVLEYANPVSPAEMLIYLKLAYSLEQGIGDITGGIVGPFQFSKIAWSEAGEGDWATEATSNRPSTRAAVKFYYLNRTRHENRSRTVFSNEIAYLYHNQGPTGAAYYLDNRIVKFGGQSLAANELFSTI